MKASELRIGNLLYFKNTHDIAKVELIHNKHFDCRDEYGSFIPNGSYEPIPLTEEWLLKFGFENSYRSDYTITMQHETNDKFGIKINNATGISLVYLGIPIRIEFIHQLQNLYFALCGEEWELKETLSK